MSVDHFLSELGMRTNFTVVILTLALMLCRILPVIFMSSLLGGDVVPFEVRMGLGVILAVVLFPGVSSQLHNIPVSAIPFVGLLLKELIVGFMLSFAGVGFESFQMAGGLADIFSGMNMAQVHVPLIDERVTVFSSLKVQLASAMFLTLNGHHVVIAALGESFLSVPLDKLPPLGRGQWAVIELMMHFFSDLLPMSIAIAGPILLATFLTDLSLGMINRVAPQIQVYFISMSIKPAVAVVIFLLVLHVIANRMTLQFADLLDSFKEGIRLFQ